MTYKLYSKRDTGGFAVEAALAKCGAPCEIITIDPKAGAQNTPEFAAINPMRQIPVLVFPDGATMTESAAIVTHLADVFPAKGLAPAPGTPAHGKFLRWMFFMAVNLYEADLRYYYAARYTTDPHGVEGVKAAAVAHMMKSFAVIEAALDPFLLGRELSIADVYLAMLTKWNPTPLDEPKFAALHAAIAADANYGPVWRDHGYGA
jgi:glutathione S-transferase